MTVETSIYTAIKGLCGNRAFRDFAPMNTVKPYVTYVQVGGESINYVDDALPSLKNGRFQFNVWGDGRDSVSSLMLQIEAALIQSAEFQARPIGAANNSYDHDMAIYGAMQDFTIWSTR